MAWTTLTLEVTTPLFNGGADPEGQSFQSGQDEGVRVASIRGAMRFWFRALVGCLTGPDLRLLASLERRVFGSASVQGHADDSSAASPVLLRIPRQPDVVPATARHDFLLKRPRHESRWILYLMGQGLADLAQLTIRRPYVPPGQEFQLKIGFRHRPGDGAESRSAIEGLALASLWLVCTYGGLGARTRRGFGGVRIIRAEGELPGPWRAENAMLTPGLGHYERLRFLWPDGALGTCMRYIQVLAPAGEHFDPRSAWGGNPPSFPVLSRTHTQARTSGGDAFLSWSDTLIHAGEQLRHFRASAPNTRPTAHYQPKIETPEWADVVHGNSDRFAVGALGLPVVYKDGYVVNVDHNGPEGPLRRASPLWLRVVGNEDQWRLLSFAFHGEFLPGPGAPSVNLWQRGSRRKRLQVTHDDVQRLSSQWIDVMSQDESFADGQHRK